MRRSRKTLLAAAIAAVFSLPHSASAELTAMEGGVSAASQYLWRGVQLTDDAALQGWIDLRDDSGLHADFFTSSVSGGTELQAAGGYGMVVKDVHYDFGARLYYLPQFESSNFLELYAAIKVGDFGAALSASQDSGTYLEANYRVPLQNAWQMDFHLGRYSVDENDRGLTIPSADYFDYHLALGREIEGGVRIGFKVAGTTLDDGEAPMQTDNFRTVISISKSFPL